MVQVRSQIRAMSVIQNVNCSPDGGMHSTECHPPVVIFNIIKSGVYICGRIALLSQQVTQIAQMAEHWYGLSEDLGLSPGVGL